METAIRAVLSVGAVGASVGLSAGISFRKRDPEDDEATRVWLDSSWPRWGLPRRVFAWVWGLAMYPLLAYLVYLLFYAAAQANQVKPLLWAAAIHLLANSLWVPSLARWEAATLAVATSLIMVLTSAYIALTYAGSVTKKCILPRHARAALWIYVAWVAYSASITSNFLFADDD